MRNNFVSLHHDETEPRQASTWGREEVFPDITSWLVTRMALNRKIHSESVAVVKEATVNETRARDRIRVTRGRVCKPQFG